MPTSETLIRLDRLRDRLITGGVAHHHVKRTLAELGDHYDDALRAEHATGLNGSEAMARAWQRLGSEDDIVSTVLARPELRSLPARYPRVISAAGPIVLWLGVMIGSVFMIAAIFKVLVMAGIAPPPRTSIEPLWLQNLMNAVLFVYVRILPVVIGAAMAAVFARRLLVPRWTIAGAVAISLTSAFSTYALIFPKVVGEGGELNLGMGINADELPVSLTLAALNVALIMAAYGLARRRAT